MSEHMAYAGRKECGCLVAATVDNPERAKEVRSWVSRMMRDGLTVHRMTVEEVREQLNECKCSKQEALSV